jgi:AsmA protein
MRSMHVISRLRKLVLMFLACLLLAVLAPLMFERRPVDEFAVSSVIASQRDFHIVTAPVRLSEAPDLVLHRSVLYAYGNVTAGVPYPNVVLDGPVFTLNASGVRSTAPHLEGAAAGDPSALTPLVENLMGLGFDLLTIRRGTLHVARADGSTETLSDLQAELTGRKKGHIAGRGSFTVRGQRVAFDVTFPLAAEKRTATRWPLKAALTGGGLLEASFEGHLDVADDLRLDGQALVSAPSLRKAARWFGLPVAPAEGLNAFSIRSQLSWSRRAMVFENAKVSIDGNEASGHLTLNMAGTRPLVDGTLDFASLDLTAYVEAARAYYYAFDFTTGTFATFDLSFPLIKAIDADLRLSAAKVAVKGHVLGAGAATISVQGRKLQADIVELEVAGGKATAQVTADGNEPTPRYAVRGKVENLDAGAAAGVLLGSPAVAGRATLTFNLAGAGSTPSEVVRGLSGKAALAIPEGRLALDMRALRNATKSEEAQALGALSKGQAPLDHLEARVNIVDGIAYLESGLARSGSVGLAATGRVGLGEGSLDLRLGLKAGVATDRAPTAADMEGADAVSVSGPWTEPVVRGPISK